MVATPGMNLFDASIFGDSLNMQAVNATNKRVAGMFIAPKAGTLTYVGYLVPSTPVANGPVDVRLEGITTLGVPDGTLIATGASASSTISASGWVWQALGTPPTVTAGQLLAGVVAFQAASAVNASIAYSINNSRQLGGPYGAQDNGTGTWSIVANIPTVCLKYSDGTIISGGCPLASYPTAAYASGTNPNERAAVFTAPFDCTLFGIKTMLYPSSRSTGTWEVNAYSGTGTTPISGGTVSVGAALAASIFAPKMFFIPFATPLALTSGTTYRISVKATGAGTINLPRFTWNSTAERDAAIGPVWSDTRNGGAWIGASTTTTEQIIPVIDTVTVSGGGGSYAAAGDVRSGVNRGDGTLGTLTVPAVGDVQTAVTYGAAGTEYTGTFAYPAVGNVRSGTGYGAGGTEFTGTLTLPDVADVRLSTTYGAAGTEFTGTLVVSGGSGLSLAQLQTELTSRGLTSSFTSGTAGGVNLLKVNGTDVTVDTTPTVILDASQPNYAPSKAGDAMTLTSGERTAVANKVESEIIDDTDSEKVLQAITDKIAAVNPSLDDLTLGGIASAVWANAVRTLTSSALSSGRLTEATDVTPLATTADLSPLATASAVAALPTAAQNATAILAAGDVDGFTLEQTLKLCLAALAGKVSGAAGASIAIRAADDSKTRITATVDISGNRTVVTLDAAG